MVHSMAINKLLEESQKNKDHDITLESTKNADKMGSVCVFHGSASNKIKTAQENEKTFPGKVYVLKSLQTAFLHPDTTEEEEEDVFVFDKQFTFKQGNDVRIEEWGFPSIVASFESDKSELISFSWEFSKDCTIWQPLDWSVVTMNKNVAVLYLAVLQADGENFTYVVEENIETSKWMAGVSKRKYGEVDGTFIQSTAKSVDLAIDKLKKHFDSAFNRLTADGTPIEIGWSKEFGYDQGMYHVCSAVVSSDILENDAQNEMLDLAETSRNQIYPEMFRNAFGRSHE